MAKKYDPIKTTEYADLLKNIKERITEKNSNHWLEK